LAQEAAEVFNGEVEIDESYFGGVRKGKRGRGAAGKVVVFGMLKRHGKVYTVVVENTKTKGTVNNLSHIYRGALTQFPFMPRLSGSRFLL
jgi:hypothetical protein